MDPDGIDRARELRAHASFPERLLWGRLRRGSLGVRFRRQQPIGPFIVDFYCAELRLVVELDGLSHLQTGAADLARHRFLEREGFVVIRFWNDELLRDLDGVVDQIASVVRSRESHTNRQP